jgi:methanogenic corrinoid protein MtbC1
MDGINKKFLEYLEIEDKETAVNFILELLNFVKIDIPTLYLEVLAPSLNNMTCNGEDENICIWKEHIRSSIIRTIIECCSPYVSKESKLNKQKNEKILVVCPSEEYHELGARMAADFFTIWGYNSIFVGSNTPQNELINAMNIIDPRYIAISVSNSYNLVTVKKVISRIKEKKVNKGLKVIVGGYAFKGKPELYKEVGADFCINSFEQIEIISKGAI